MFPKKSAVPLTGRLRSEGLSRSIVASIFLWGAGKATRSDNFAIKFTIPRSLSKKEVGLAEMANDYARELDTAVFEMGLNCVMFSEGFKSFTESVGVHCVVIGDLKTLCGFRGWHRYQRPIEYLQNSDLCFRNEYGQLLSGDYVGGTIRLVHSSLTPEGEVFVVREGFMEVETDKMELVDFNREIEVTMRGKFNPKNAARFKMKDILRYE